MSNKSNWFEWKDEDLKELGIKDFQFFDYLKEGLYPYTKYTYEPIPCPAEHHAYGYTIADLDEIEFTLEQLNKLDAFEKEVEKAKTKTVYTKDTPPGISYILEHHKDYLSNRDSNKGYPITSEIVEELKTYRNELREQKQKIEKRLKDIRNDPERFSWKYFVLPSTAEECDKLESELTDKRQNIFNEESIFKKDVALEIKRKFDSEATGKDEEVTSIGIDSQELADLRGEEYFENPALLQLVKEADQEIKIIYSAMIKDIRSKEIKLADSTPSDLQQVAIDALNDPEYTFKWMKEKYVKDPNFFTETRDSSHPKRYFRETVLQQINKEKTPKKIITKREIRNLLKKI